MNFYSLVKGASYRSDLIEAANDKELHLVHEDHRMFFEDENGVIYKPSVTTTMYDQMMAMQENSEKDSSAPLIMPSVSIEFEPCDFKNYKITYMGYLIVATGELIYSCNRHDFVWDETGLYFVDGGKDYVRTNIVDDAHAVHAEIDLFNGTFETSEGTYDFEFRKNNDEGYTEEKELKEE